MVSTKYMLMENYLKTSRHGLLQPQAETRIQRCSDLPVIVFM